MILSKMIKRLSKLLNISINNESVLSVKIMLKKTHKQTKFTRREITLLAIGSLIGFEILPKPAWANSKTAQQMLAHLTKNQSVIQSANLKLDLPTEAYTGRMVPFAVEMELPKNQINPVQVIHVLAEKNPFPMVASFFFTPYSGKVFVRTKIRLSGAQHVLAIAELEDGTFLFQKQFIDVTVDGCVD